MEDQHELENIPIQKDATTVVVSGPPKRQM